MTAPLTRDDIIASMRHQRGHYDREEWTYTDGTAQQRCRCGWATGQVASLETAIRLMGDHIVSMAGVDLTAQPHLAATPTDELERRVQDWVDNG